VNFGLVWCQLRENAPQAERLLAEVETDPMFPRSGRVSLVEDQVDHLEHRRKTRAEVCARGDFEGHVRLAQGPLGADDPLGDGRLWNQVRASDLVSSQATQQP